MTVPQTCRELSNKTWVVSVIISGKAKAYPTDDFPSGQTVTDSVGGRKLIVRYDAATRHPQVSYLDGEHIYSVMVFWFAWQEFYPDTELWRP